MFAYLTRKKENLVFLTGARILVFILSFSLIFSPSAGYAQSVFVPNLPLPGTMVGPSPVFVPVLLKGMTIHPDDPLKFDFIIDSGNTDFDENKIKEESERLVKYFLASMTIPKDDLWVNLSPNEPERIIPDELGKTDLGRDMLAQDYILKQLTASLMYPEKELGKEFWNKVYQKAQEQFGTSEIPVDTFNKVWILPETATVYEHGQTVYIVDARLKVMLDSDYAAMQYASKIENGGGKGEKEHLDQRLSSNLDLQSSIIKEIILPEIEKEVNEGQNFAPLRQIYHSLILAKWYKETIKNSLLSQVYVDKKLIEGIRLEDGQLKGDDGSIIDPQSSIVDQIYDQYMDAYKKGVFNYIKEDYVAMDSQQESTATSRAPTRGDRLSNEVIPRKYFSGGEEFEKVPLAKIEVSSPIIDRIKNFTGKGFMLIAAVTTASILTGTHLAPSALAQPTDSEAKAILAQSGKSNNGTSDYHKSLTLEETKQMLDLRVKNSMLVGKAYKGEKGFERGGVQFNRLDRKGDMDMGPAIVGKDGVAIYGSEMVQRVFDRINELPVVDRANIQQRLQFSTHETPFLITMDVDGDGRTEEVFATFYLPIDKEMILTQKNSETGEIEIHVMVNNLLKYRITESQVVVPVYGPLKLETRLLTYQNPIGIKDAFKNIESLTEYVQKVKKYLTNKPIRTEEVVTVLRILQSPDKEVTNPYEHVVSKVVINFLSGQVILDTYGFFSHPISRVSTDYIVEYKFDKLGGLDSFSVFDNATEEKGNLENLEKLFSTLKNPVKGRKIFVFSLNRSRPIHVMNELKSADWRVRAFAAEALGWLNDESAVKPLSKVLNDKNAVVRYAAKKALEKIKKGSASSPVTMKSLVINAMAPLIMLSALPEPGFAKATPPLASIILSENAQELIRAASAGDLEGVQALLRQRVNINEKYADMTALMAAAFKGHLTIVEALLAHGAAVDIKESNGITALMVAAVGGHVAIVQTLIENGADVNVQDHVYGQTALMWAAGNGLTEIAKILLENGADANIRSKENETALMFAAKEGHDKIVYALLDKNANVNLKGSDGHSALFLAVENGHTRTAEALLNNGADADIQLKNGLTPLMIASADNHITIVQALLKSGADINIKALNGWTALDFARQEGNTEIIKILLDARAKKNDSSSPLEDNHHQKSVSDDVGGVDSARNARGINSFQDKDYGGIDLNEIDVDRQGGGVSIQFDPAKFQDIIDMGVTGFAPVIISITPLPSVLPLLGLEPRKEEETEKLSRLN